jgi:hypothetical protein
MTLARRRTMSHPSAATPSAFGTHIGDWFAQAGDHAYYVADGSTLDGANVDLATATHPSTSGAFNGWVPIMCQTKGGSVLDLSDPTSGPWRGGLDLRYDGVGHGFTKLPLRIMLGGFTIRFGTVIPQWVRYLRFWHCDFTWADTVWQAYYDGLYFSAHGTHPVPSPATTFDSSVFGSSPNWHPTTVGMDQCDNIEVYFTDFHNIGDDAVYLTSSNLYLRGVRFDDVYHHGTNYFNPATGGDLIHSDTVQGAGCNVTFKNVGFGGHWDFEGTGAGSVGLNGDNFWLYGSSISAAGFGTDGSHNVVGALTNGQWFACGQYYHPGVNPATQSTPYYDASSDRLLDAYDPPGLTWDGASGTAWAAAHKILPSGVAVAGGLITPDLIGPSYPASYPSVPSAYAHPANPGLVDQAANPYGSWSTFFNRLTTNNPSAGAYGWP